MRYLKGTLDYGLRFEAYDKGSVELHGYADADWAGDVDTRKSTSGFLFLIGNATISWRTKKQTVIALSSTEAEYVSLCSATQETRWFRYLLESIGFKQHIPITIYEESQGAIALSKNPKSHPRTKHIDIKYHYVKEATEKADIELDYCPTDLLFADIPTKALPRIWFEKLRTFIGVKNCH